MNRAQTVPADPPVRLTISWSREVDRALRSYLGTQGMKKGDISKFIEDSVRWQIFQRTVQESRKSFAAVPREELQKRIDEAVEEVRTRQYRQRAQRR